MSATPAGDLIQRITYVRAGASQDEYGEEIETWAALGTDRAKVLWGTGAERRQAGQMEASQTATFRVRSSGLARSVGPKDAIDFAGARWNVTAIAPLAIRPAEIEFTATRAAG